MKKILTLFTACAAFCMFAGELADFQPSRDGGWTPKAAEKSGAFTAAGRKVLFSAAKIKIDPNAEYRITGKFRNTGDRKAQLLFFGFECLNKNGVFISSPTVLLVPGTEAELVADLKKGSKEALVRDASKWSTQKRPWVTMFHAKNDFADLPNFNFGPGIAKIEKQANNWKITFKTPVNRDYKAGVKIRQHYHGPGRTYCAANYFHLKGKDWVTVSGTIKGVAQYGAPLKQWWHGTETARVVILAEPDSVEFKDVVVTKIGGTVSIADVKKNAERQVKPAQDPLAPLFDKYYREIAGKLDDPHPRLFFNDAEFARMRERVKKEPALQLLISNLRTQVDLYPDVVNEETFSRKYGGHPVFYGKDKFGSPASRAAFLWKMTGDKKYLTKALNIIRYGAKWYNNCYDQKKVIGWYSFTRIFALCAWDWIYNDIPAKDRKEIGAELMKHVIRMQDHAWIVKYGMHSNGEGLSNWQSSFYGNPLIKFYAGLAFHNEGINNKIADQYLKEGLQDHVKMLRYRAWMAGEDGGGNNSTPGYVGGEAPYCEWFIYYQWKMMTGRNLAMDFPNNGMFPNWLHYATFRGIDGALYEHGTGGAWHMDNKIDLSSRYLLQYRHFYPTLPTAKIVDAWVYDKKGTRNPAIYCMGNWRFTGYYPWMGFMFDFVDHKTYKKDEQFFGRMPQSYYFKNLGQTYMYSGLQPDSTYVMFTCGAKSLAHKQPDENHFVIYKGGFLAMDTGTRVHTLKHNHLDYWHDANYYAASIAHNVVTIRMEGEVFKVWPKQTYFKANHGGMNKTIGGEVRAYEYHRDLFTYVLGDSTAAYHEGKCKKMYRQFVFIQPDYFVICDTVQSVKPDQPQTWLLHSQNEPQEQGDIFHFDENKGRLFCRTFLPQDYKRIKIGGHGKEFWSDGENYYHIDPDYIKVLAKRGIKDPLWGNWRVELTAGNPRTDVRFLNLLQVGMKDKLNKMVASRYVKQNGMEGVSFTAVDGTEYTVLFNAAGNGGHFKAVRNGKVLYDKPLTTQIQTQTTFK